MIRPGFGCTFRTSTPLLLALLHHAAMSWLQIYAVINVGGLGIREWKLFRVIQPTGSSGGYLTTLTKPEKATSSEVARLNKIDTAPILTYLQYSVDRAALTRLCAIAFNVFFFRKIDLPFELARSTMTTRRHCFRDCCLRKSRFTLRVLEFIALTVPFSQIRCLFMQGQCLIRGNPNLLPKSY